MKTRARGSFLQRVLPLPTLVVVALVCFSRLAAQPHSWLVDGERPSIDRARRESELKIGNDLTRFHLPKLWKIVAAIKSVRRPPFWDRFGFGGRPFVGNPQAGVFYPPYWIAWRYPSGATLAWLTVAHLVWGGWGGYFLARSQKLDRFAATVAAGCFEASPYLLAQTFEGHYPQVWGASWYPWAFLAAVRMREGDRRGALFLPAIFAMMVSTGHAQEVFPPAIAFLIWACRDLSRLGRSGREREAFRSLAPWAAIVAATAGLAAIEIVPIALALPWTVSAGGYSLSAADHYHINLINVFQLFSPQALGGPADYHGFGNYWETLFSFGWTPLVLARVGARSSQHRASARGWAALAILSIVFAAGRRLGLFVLIYELIPGTQWFRTPARALFLADLAVAMLAGFGVREVLESSNAPDEWYKKNQISFFIMSVIVLCFAAVAFCPPRWFAAPIGRLAREPIFLATSAAVALAFGVLRKRSRNPQRIAVLLGTIALAELCAHGFQLIRVSPAERFLNADAVAAAIERVRPAGPFRIRARDIFYDDAHALRAGLEKTNEEDLFQPKFSAELAEVLYPMFHANNPRTEASARLRRAVLDRMNVRFLITDRPEPNSPWPLVATGRRNPRESFYIYENKTAMPRAYVVPKAFVAADRQMLLTDLPRVVPAREAAILPIDPLDGIIGKRQRFQEASIERIGDNRLRIRTTTAGVGLLVIGETWMPGWRATLAGQPVTIFRADRAWRAIVLPTPGKHVVDLVYEPPGLRLGAAITLASLLVWPAIWARFFQGSRTAAERPSSY